MSVPTVLDKRLKKATPDDTGLTRPPVAIRVSAHKDEVRSIVHGYFAQALKDGTCCWSLSETVPAARQTHRNNTCRVFCVGL